MKKKLKFKKLKIDYTGQNVLVTGGTRGIGKDLVNNFISLGANVWYTGRSPDIIKKGYIPVDFSQKDQMEKFLQEIPKLQLDVVINNVGTNKIGPIEDYDEKDFVSIINLNLTSCFRIMKAVIPGMKIRSYGRIVNITSISSEISMPLRTAYCSSKFGLVGLTKAAAVESAASGVLINSVGPGVTETKLTVDVLGRERMEEIARSIPAHRLATVEDISRVVMFIASGLNTYMVGQNIIVDGGYTCV